MKYIYSVLLLVMLSVVGCTKTPDSTSSVASTLMTGRWHITSGTLKMKLPNGNDTSLNYYSLFLPVCHQDDYIRFYSSQYGAVYTSTVKCDPSEPDSVSFGWQLTNNNAGLNIYNAQFFYYSALETIQPYQIDTLERTPTVVVDSYYYAGSPSKVDSIYNLSFTEIPALPTYPSTTQVDISNAAISNLSSASFTVSFSVFNASTVYPDSVGNRQAYPVTTADTFYYSLTYTSF